MHVVILISPSWLTQLSHLQHEKAIVKNDHDYITIIVIFSLHLTEHEHY